MTAAVVAAAFDAAWLLWMTLTYDSSFDDA